MTSGDGSAARFGQDAWSSGALPLLVVGSWAVVVSGGVSVVGRRGRPGEPGPDLDLTEQDASQLVSRRHAELHFAGGVLSVRDLESANGTRLQGLTLLPARDYPLQPGDTLVFGDVVARVVALRGAGEAVRDSAPTATRRPAGPPVVAPAAEAAAGPRPAAHTRDSAGGQGARRSAEPQPPAAPVPAAAPVAPAPAFPNATIIPAHHRVEEDEPEAEPEERTGRLGTVADRLRRRRDR